MKRKIPCGRDIFLQEVSLLIGDLFDEDWLDPASLISEDGIGLRQFQKRDRGGPQGHGEVLIERGFDA